MFVLPLLNYYIVYYDHNSLEFKATKISILKNFLIHLLFCIVMIFIAIWGQGGYLLLDLSITSHQIWFFIVCTLIFLRFILPTIISFRLIIKGITIKIDSNSSTIYKNNNKLIDVNEINKILVKIKKSEKTSSTLLNKIISFNYLYAILKNGKKIKLAESNNKNFICNLSSNISELLKLNVEKLLYNKFEFSDNVFKKNQR